MGPSLSSAPARSIDPAQSTSPESPERYDEHSLYLVTTPAEIHDLRLEAQQEAAAARANGASVDALAVEGALEEKLRSRGVGEGTIQAVTDQGWVYEPQHPWPFHTEPPAGEVTLGHPQPAGEVELFLNRRAA